MYKLLPLLTIACALAQKRNICPTIQDYLTTPLNQHCWYNPDVGTDMPELVTQHGYNLETYEIETEDGFILTTYRLPNKNSTKGVIFLAHPSTASCTLWVDKGNSSLGYLLYHEGYDVWLGNFRGNFYSRKHKTLNPNSNEFWDWSYHEMAIYDTPSIVDFIIKKTQVGKISFIGHSQGGTIAFIYASLLPQHAEKYINNFILFGPAVYLKYGTSPVIILAPFSGALYYIQEKLHNLEFVPHNGYIINLAKECYKTPIGMKLCATLLQFYFGENWKGFDPSLVPVMVTQNFAGISLKSINHYAQIVNSGKFSFYDYGKSKNQQLYKSDSPPEYPIQNIKSAFYLIAGGHDALVTVRDVQQLFNNIPQEAKAKSKMEVIEGYNHVDFAYSKYVTTLLYGPVIKYLNNMKG